MGNRHVWVTVTCGWDATCGSPSFVGAAYFWDNRHILPPFTMAFTPVPFTTGGIHPRTVYHRWHLPPYRLPQVAFTPYRLPQVAFTPYRLPQVAFTPYRLAQVAFTH